MHAGADRRPAGVVQTAQPLIGDRCPWRRTPSSGFMTHFSLLLRHVLPRPETPSPFVARLDFPLMVPRGIPVDSHMRVCLCGFTVRFYLERCWRSAGWQNPRPGSPSCSLTRNLFVEWAPAPQLSLNINSWMYVGERREHQRQKRQWKRCKSDVRSRSELFSDMKSRSSPQTQMRCLQRARTHTQRENWHPSPLSVDGMSLESLQFSSFGWI